ncbi:MAG: hypothetical protein WDN26_21015 [Chitinophagaceae bacterium]
MQKDISKTDNLIAIDQEVLAKTGLLIEAAVNAEGNKTVTSAEVLKLVEYYNAKIEKSENEYFLITGKTANN